MFRKSWWIGLILLWASAVNAQTHVNNISALAAVTPYPGMEVYFNTATPSIPRAVWNASAGIWNFYGANAGTPTATPTVPTATFTATPTNTPTITNTPTQTPTWTSVSLPGNANQTWNNPSGPPTSGPTFTPVPGASFGVTVVTVAYQQSSGTNGGTASTGSFHKSPINTIIQNDLSIPAISSNTWILPAGTYLISGWQVFGEVQNCQIELYNVGSSSVVATGTDNYNNTNVQTTCSLIPQKITFAGSVTLALEYYALASVGTADLGLAASTGNVESYEWVSFTKTQ